MGTSRRGTSSGAGKCLGAARLQHATRGPGGRPTWALDPVPPSGPLAADLFSRNSYFRYSFGDNIAKFLGKMPKKSPTMAL
jgi:hypothetical protein